MPRKTMDIQFPAVGVVRRLGLFAAAKGRGPFPTPWAVNVRLEDSLTNRLRGGSWTAISAAARPAEIRYRDRLLTFSSGAITATRMGDDTDTTLSADVSDAIRPALFQLSYAGAQGDDVVALIPHKDQYLLGFTATQTWVQQGDPLASARSRVSDQIGIIGADAWCVAHDTVYFLSSRGLYSIGADGSGLKAISEDAVPEDLTGVTDASCTLTYRHADRGVYVHKTALDWFYDIERGGFWPFDTSTANSHVLLGPMQLGSANAYGRVMRLFGVMAASSADVTWRIIVGDTVEEAADDGKSAITAALAGNDYSSYVHSSGTWEAGISQMSYPRARGQWVVLWLSSAGAWAFERASMIATSSGQWR